MIIFRVGVRVGNRRTSSVSVRHRSSRVPTRTVVFVSKVRDRVRARVRARVRFF